jgi:hypothetical protein
LPLASFTVAVLPRLTARVAMGTSLPGFFLAAVFSGRHAFGFGTHTRLRLPAQSQTDGPYLRVFVRQRAASDPKVSHDEDAQARGHG